MRLQSISKRFVLNSDFNVVLYVVYACVLILDLRLIEFYVNIRNWSSEIFIELRKKSAEIHAASFLEYSKQKMHEIVFTPY